MICTPERFGGGAFLLVVVLAIFLCSVFGTWAIDSFFPIEPPRLVGRELTLRERARSEASLWDGSLTRLIEDDMRVRSRVRKALVPPFSWLLYRWLSEGKGVYVGEEGWLFLVSRAREPALPVEQAATRVAHQFAALDRLLDSRGTRLVAVPVPRKAVVLEEFLPSGIRHARKFDERLVLAMQECGIRTADLLTVFDRAETSTLFHLGDTHWTPDAERLAAEEVARVAGLWIAPEERDTELRRVPGGAYGLDTFRWIGADVEDPKDPEVQPHVRDSYDVYDRRSGTLVQRRNPEAMGSVALVGTSFTARRSLSVYLRHFSGEQVWNAASPGEGPMVPLRQFLAWRAERSWPAILLVEFPLHLVLNEEGVPAIGRIFAGWAPPALIEIPTPSAWDWLPAGAAPASWQTVASLAPGCLGRSGDGTLSLRLTAETPLAGNEVRIQSHGFRLESPWPPGKKEIVLPLIGDGSHGARITIAMRSRQGPRIKLVDVEVVAPLSSTPIAEGEVHTPVERSGARWGQVIRFAGTGLIPEQGALKLICGQRGALTVDLLFSAGDGPERVLERQEFLPGAPIVLGLHGKAGRRLIEVNVMGRGPVPVDGIVAARLLGPLR